MVFIKDIQVFKKRVGALVWPEQFDGLGITPCSLLGMFSYYRLKEILVFCAENPKYHILSITPDELFHNKMIGNGHLFYLAEGDDNPNILSMLNSFTPGFSRPDIQ